MTTILHTADVHLDRAYSGAGMSPTIACARREELRDAFRRFIDLALETGRNLIHGSDSPESAKREIALFFREDELHSYARDVDRWLFEVPD